MTCSLRHTGSRCSPWSVAGASRGSALAILRSRVITTGCKHAMVQGGYGLIEEWAGLGSKQRHVSALVIRRARSERWAPADEYPMLIRKTTIVFAAAVAL